MPFDLLERPLSANAYGDRRFTFLDQAAYNDLANITAIDLIENGDRTARENWQNRQLTNLLRHAYERSPFWRKRMPSRMINHGIMKYLPVQSREDVMTQANLEGSLHAGDANAPISSYASTGSTGTPVKIYTVHENAYYNSIRSMAQFFMDDLSLDENRVHIIPPTSMVKLENASFATRKTDSLGVALSRVFRNGSLRKIVYRHDDNALIKELLKEPFGYLVSPSRYIDTLLSSGGIELFKKLGIKLWVHVSDTRDPEIATMLGEIGVRSLSNYSAAEIGPIAFESTRHKGYVHVGHTN